MSNCFTFKSFSVRNDLAAMKVGTDAVLLGAWASVENAKTVLDVGTGTGILSLMTAQRNLQADIIAIDIDENAIKEATLNINATPWKSRIEPKQISLQEYAKTNNKFDYIICNPPYFKSTLQSPSRGRQTAREHKDLDIKAFFELSCTLLNPKATVGLVYPYNEYDKVITIAKENNLILKRLLKVKSVPHKPYKRFLGEFSSEDLILNSAELVIEDKGRHQYSDSYKELTKDFYLNF